MQDAASNDPFEPTHCMCVFLFNKQDYISCGKIKINFYNTTLLVFLLPILVYTIPGTTCRYGTYYSTLLGTILDVGGTAWQIITWYQVYIYFLSNMSITTQYCKIVAHIIPPCLLIKYELPSTRTNTTRMAK